LHKAQISITGGPYSDQDVLILPVKVSDLYYVPTGLGKKKLFY